MKRKIELGRSRRERPTVHGPCERILLKTKIFLNKKVIPRSLCGMGTLNQNIKSPK